MTKCTHCFRKQNNVKTPLSEMKIYAELFKTKYNLISLSFYSNDHRRISLPHPLAFQSVFCGYVHLNSIMAELGMEISNNGIDLWAKKVKRFRPSFFFYRI